MELTDEENNDDIDVGGGCDDARRRSASGNGAHRYSHYVRSLFG